MQFIITAYDGTDGEAAERRMRVRPRHLENIRKVKETGRVVCAGGIKKDGAAIGSFLILDFASRELFEAYLASEPYVTEKVWETITVEECAVVIMEDEMVGN